MCEVRSFQGVKRLAPAPSPPVITAPAFQVDFFFACLLRCILGDVRFWVGAHLKSSCLVSLPSLSRCEICSFERVRPPAPQPSPPVIAAVEPRGGNLKVLKNLSREPRPESGLDCFFCAIFARQRQGDGPSRSPGLRRERDNIERAYSAGRRPSTQTPKTHHRFGP